MDTNSQHSRILKMLKKRPKSGVENYKFPQAHILDYTARISELRQDGHNILAERQKINGRSTGVWVYHLIEDPSNRFKFKFPKRSSHAN